MTKRLLRALLAVVIAVGGLVGGSSAQPTPALANPPCCYEWEGEDQH